MFPALCMEGKAGLTIRSRSAAPWGPLGRGNNAILRLQKHEADSLLGGIRAVLTVQAGGVGGLCCLGWGSGPCGLGSLPFWYLKLAWLGPQHES